MKTFKEFYQEQNHLSHLYATYNMQINIITPDISTVKAFMKKLDRKHFTECTTLYCPEDKYYLLFKSDRPKMLLQYLISVASHMFIDNDGVDDIDIEIRPVKTDFFKFLHENRAEIINL